MARKADIEVFIDKFSPLMEQNENWADIKRIEYWNNIAEDSMIKKAIKENKLWTCVEGDNGNWYISPGKHFVNRLFYIITKNSYNDKTRDYLY